MSRVLLAALLGSLIIHTVVLFGTDFRWPDEVQEKQLIQATLLKPPPVLPVAQVKPVLPAAPASQPVKPRLLRQATEQDNDLPVPADNVAAPREVPESSTSTAEIPEPSPPVNRVVEPVLPSSGSLSFSVYKDSLGMSIGRAEHQWAFPGDGTYRLTSIMETSGLISLFKPVRQVLESRGHLTASGLQPAHFSVSKNGEASSESADFDWSTAEVRLVRGGSVQAIANGTQDMLSLHYQLAYLENPENGSTIGVVTGKRYERYALDSLGEEYIDTPVRRFRTLHLRAAGETVTEIWIALDQQRLPVKIRFTDKKGDSYELRLTEIGADLPPSD